MNTKITNEELLEQLKYDITSNSQGTWYKFNGQLHRDEGPAVIYYNGKKEWYKHGKLHREDGPAVEWKDGTQYWYKNGLKHREDGPAVIYSDGGKSWYLNGKLDTKKNITNYD